VHGQGSRAHGIKKARFRAADMTLQNRGNSKKPAKHSSSVWRDFWEAKSLPSVSDFEFDRGTAPRHADTERLADQELVRFIDSKPTDVVFDAGCGTGANLLLLHSAVERIIGMDYAEAAIIRCRHRLSSSGIQNVDLFQGSISRVPLPDKTVNRVLCLSVLQYLDDDQVRTSFGEFARILKPGGVLILHVKNLSSLYLATLAIAKHLLSVLGKQRRLEYFRPFRWYVRELRSAGFEVTYYNTFNLITIEGMPAKLRSFLQMLELKHANSFLLRTSLARRLGSELKLRARLIAT
jgi:ubiquinone/menaquinone biosynthesis C-methylase UbiE